MKRQYLVTLLLLFNAVFLITIVTINRRKEWGSETMQHTYKDMLQEEAVRFFETETNYILLDVRTKEEYESGYIKGAINLPNEEIGDREIALLPDKNAKIFVYCRSGNRSKQAAEKLVKLGYTDIINIGGIQTWQGEIVTP